MSKEIAKRLGVVMVAGGILGASGAAIACFKSAPPVRCCETIGFSLDMTRTCGVGHDQDCPDKIQSNPQMRLVKTGLSGKEDWDAIESTGDCKFSLGRCTGSWGSGLCEYEPSVSISCEGSRPSGDGCPKQANDEGRTTER